jgi:hypothetical protein
MPSSSSAVTTSHHPVPLRPRRPRHHRDGREHAIAFEVGETRDECGEGSIDMMQKIRYGLFTPDKLGDHGPEFDAAAVLPVGWAEQQLRIGALLKLIGRKPRGKERGERIIPYIRRTRRGPAPPPAELPAVMLGPPILQAL